MGILAVSVGMIAANIYHAEHVIFVKPDYLCDWAHKGERSIAADAVAGIFQPGSVLVIRDLLNGHFFYPTRVTGFSVSELGFPLKIFHDFEQ